MTDTDESSEQDRALKAKHRAMWAMGDYPAVATAITAPVGIALVEASGVGAGDRVLDVAAGSGSVAIPAARAGADVVASDLTPELFDAGRRLAGEAGVEVDWREADAEALPFVDAEFDVVLSCVGVMFAPHHQASADELVRVCRPGGTIGLASWTPPLWGREEHVRELLGDRVTEVTARRDLVRIDRFTSPTGFRDFFKEAYGPTVAVYKHISGDPAKVESLDADLDELARRHSDSDWAMEWEYLLLTARRA